VYFPLRCGFATTRITASEHKLSYAVCLARYSAGQHHLHGYREKLQSDPTYLTQHAVLARDEEYFALPFSAQIELTIEPYLPSNFHELADWMA
jgi:hypothetical protein